MPGSLCDVNVLLALVHERHAHSQRATRWIDTVTDRASVHVCRVSQLGLLRLLTSPRILGEEALNPREAWAVSDALLSDERFTLDNEPPELTDRWKELSFNLQPGATLNTDVYLAALARAAGQRLVTFDSGFHRFPRLELVLLQ